MHEIRTKRESKVGKEKELIIHRGPGNQENTREHANAMLADQELRDLLSHCRAVARLRP